MSKGTNDGSRWCGWKWARTPAAPATRATARPTARRAASALLALLVALSCSRSSPQRDYDLAWKAHLRGELASAFQLSSDGAAKHPETAEWHWRFRLLEAETLVAL